MTFREHLALPALAELRDRQVAGTIFADFPFGGPLIWLGYPDWKVAYDGRYYLYGDTEWERFAQIQSGRFGLERIDATYHPVALVLHPRRNRALIDQADRDGGQWCAIHRDKAVVIFVRAAAPEGASAVGAR